MSIYNFHLRPSVWVKRFIYAITLTSLIMLWSLPCGLWVKGVLTLAIIVYARFLVKRQAQGHRHLRFSNEHGWRQVQPDQTTRAVSIHPSTVVTRHFIGLVYQPYGGQLKKQWLCRDSVGEGHFAHMVRVLLWYKN